ncbi:hypothetical protein SAMN05421827_11270 [Pedobacter terrae]|uniref:Uncharacterized protein n=1 Tax=Pedobacter terrae TaxID=405671 RepID=A0A1G7XSZ0_9SPHI|nr:hypothetical protein [Pedobacter terrae]SDG87329.1 hypothetical protein SAMN05421827_11270 [Pedobacter terrae]
MNTIEQQLWEYIDGDLDEFSKKAIEEKIKSDARIKVQYEELLKLNSAFSALDLDEPSMSFTRNVMESIALAPAPVAMKTKVDKKIIYAIGGFFIVSLLFLFGYSIYSSNLSMPKLDFNFNFNLDRYITPTVLYSFLFFDLVIGLVFLDQFLRKRINKEH